MSDSAIREVAEQIVSEQLLQNWKFYLVLGGLSLIASFVGNWLSSYLKKRAETYATKADLQEVIAQIRATTHATEQVRVALSHADWVTKEWKSLRRQKLEELLGAAYSLDGWMDEQRTIWFFHKENTHQPSPIDRVNLIGTLYFPELQAELSAVVRAYRVAIAAILSTANVANTTALDLAARQAVFADFLPEWQLLYRENRVAIVALEAKAPALMREIAGA